MDCGEIADLIWDDFDFKRRQLTINKYVRLDYHYRNKITNMYLK